MRMASYEIGDVSVYCHRSYTHIVHCVNDVSSLSSILSFKRNQTTLGLAGSEKVA